MHHLKTRGPWAISLRNEKHFQAKNKLIKAMIIQAGSIRVTNISP